MSTSLLSPGAQRVIDRLTAQEACTAFDVLEALWADESRAHDLLTGVGVTAAVMLNAAVIFKNAEVPDWSLREYLHNARLIVAHEGMAAEIRTEHLLLAGLEVASLCDVLEQMSVDVWTLRAKLLLPMTEVTTPLASGIQLRAAPVLRSESMSVARILDASANRCREGLRVVEDYARMILNDAHLSRQIKETRHALVPLLSRLHLDDAVRARDTEHDVGTSIHTAFEMARPSVWSVALASIKRVQEALRTLEEYGKTIDAVAASGIGGLRYRFYTIEKGLSATQGAIERLKDCQLYLLVTDSLCPQGAGPVVKAALSGGVDVVQLREKELPDRRFLELAKWIRDWTAEAGALFIVNDRPDLACLADADGVHVGQGDLTVHEVRQIIGGQKLVGVSTHALGQAEQAVLDGADYVGVGPVFTSRTKSFEQFAGLEYVRQLAAEVSLPAFAIGGIGLENVEQVLAAGARRIAVSSEICGAEEPERVVARLKESLLLAQAVAQD